LYPALVGHPEEGAQSAIPLVEIFADARARELVPQPFAVDSQGFTREKDKNAKTESLNYLQYEIS
jgi:hypothetical protein